MITKKEKDTEMVQKEDALCLKFNLPTPLCRSIHHVLPASFLLAARHFSQELHLHVYNRESAVNTLGHIQESFLGFTWKSQHQPHIKLYHLTVHTGSHPLRRKAHNAIGFFTLQSA